MSQRDGPVGQDPSSQTGCGRYTRQNAQASMMAATPIMYGRNGAQRAIVTAPETPNRTTAQGPMQQRPINDANVLMPIAPPVVAAVVLCNSVDMSLFTFPYRSLDLQGHVDDKCRDHKYCCQPQCARGWTFAVSTSASCPVQAPQRPAQRRRRDTYDKQCG